MVQSNAVMNTCPARMLPGSELLGTGPSMRVQSHELIAPTRIL